MILAIFKPTRFTMENIKKFHRRTQT